MEILGFNLLHWATSSLPWKDVTDPKVAEEKKKSLMEKVSTSAKKLVPTAPPVIIKYLEYVSKLKHDQSPDYEFCRKLFKEELKKIGVPASGKLVFKVDNKTPKKSQQKSSALSKKRATTNGHNEPVCEDDEDSNVEEECLPTPPKRSTRQAKVKGPSWKDCETVKTSGVIKAGEYVSSNPKPIKKKKKL